MLVQVKKNPDTNKNKKLKKKMQYAFWKIACMKSEKSFHVSSNTIKKGINYKTMTKKIGGYFLKELNRKYIRLISH